MVTGDVAMVVGCCVAVVCTLVDIYWRYSCKLIFDFDLTGGG
jgi:hypothetical protein